MDDVSKNAIKHAENELYAKLISLVSKSSSESFLNIPSISLRAA